MLDETAIKRDKRCRQEIGILSKWHNLDYEIALKIYGHGYKAGNSHGKEDGITEGYEAGYGDGQDVGSVSVGDDGNPEHEKY